MSFRDNFPYSNFHELNLDWLIDYVKKGVDYVNNIGKNLKGTVDEVLSEHPEWVATIPDGSISEGKLNDALKNKINEIDKIDKNGSFALIGKAAANTADSKGMSTCVVIKDGTDAVIYDLGNDDSATPAVCTYLSANGITKVSALIISHYHADHITLARLQNFLTTCDFMNIDTSNMVVYLPHNGINWSDFTGTNYSSVESSIITYLDTKGVEYLQPNVEGQRFMHGNVDIKFYNVNSVFYTAYYDYLLDEDKTVTDHTNYNNFSMCAMVNIADHNIWLSGDIEQPAEANMYKHVSGADICLISHHGLNLFDDDNYINAMASKINVLPVYGVRRLRAITSATGPQTSKACTVGTCLNNYEDNTIVINISNKGLEITSNGYEPCHDSKLGTIIRAGDDLDNCTTVGKKYYSISTAESAQISHWPKIEGVTLGAGMIEVLPTTPPGVSIVQKYTSYFATEHPVIAIRTYVADDSEWSPWKCIKLDISEDA